jgi:hypothetical protein
MPVSKGQIDKYKTFQPGGAWVSMAQALLMQAAGCKLWRLQVAHHDSLTKTCLMLRRSRVFTADGSTNVHASSGEVRDER